MFVRRETEKRKTLNAARMLCMSERVNGRAAGSSDSMEIVTPFAPARFQSAGLLLTEAKNFIYFQPGPGFCGSAVSQSWHG